MDTEINPLKAWLERVGETATSFMDRTELSSHTIYDLFADRNKDYGIKTLRRIEEGTGGEVTIRMISDWLERKKLNDQG